MIDQKQPEQGQVRVYAFNPNDHLVQLKSRDGAKDYLPVQWRLAWINADVDAAFATGIPVELEIETTLITLDLVTVFEEEAFVWNSEKRRSEKVVKSAPGYAHYKARVRLKIGDKLKIGNGSKLEKAVSFPDFLEKSETGSIGRALAEIGYGTQFTGDEWNEGQRIVDSPVEENSTSRESGNHRTPGNPVRESGEAPGNHSIARTQSQPAPTSNPPEEETGELATDPQINAIERLCERLKREPPAGRRKLTKVQAKALIVELTEAIKTPASGDPIKEQGIPRVMAPTSTVTAPPIKRLRQIADKYHPGRWTTIIRNATGRDIPDDNATPEDCADIYRYLIDTTPQLKAS